MLDAYARKKMSKTNEIWRNFGRFLYIFLHLINIYTFILTLRSGHFLQYMSNVYDVSWQASQRKKACHDERRRGKWCEIINSNKYIYRYAYTGVPFLKNYVTFVCFKRLVKERHPNSSHTSSSFSSSLSCYILILHVKFIYTKRMLLIIHWC